MKNIIKLIVLCCVTMSAKKVIAQNLLGKITIDSLQKEPYSTWYQKGYETYHPTASLITQLKKTKYRELKYKLFFGSWCGDSKREVPRMIKLLDSLGVNKNSIEIIGLDNGDSTIKMSPTKEELRKQIFRVPTLIVYQNNVELNRIIEFPVVSLEHDLLSIVNGESYKPNYLPLVDVANWLTNNYLVNSNVSLIGLASSIKPKLSNENLLNSISKLLYKQGKKTEALSIAKINYQIFYDKYLAIKNIGDLLLLNKQKYDAVTYLETALKIAAKEDFDDCLKQLYKAKGLQ